jgi:hypothetical protein
MSNSEMDKVIENYRAVFDIDMLHYHAMKVMHIFITLYAEKGIENNKDRIVAKNMHAQIYAAKHLLNEQCRRYATKMMLEQTLKRMEEKLKEYDSTQRETRLARKQQEATMRLLHTKENIA